MKQRKTPRKDPPAADADAGADAGADARVPERPPRTAFDSFRENVEALIVAIILAIIIRHFAVEAFEIPTGSMAPTLYGMHVWLECPNCPTEYNVAVKSDSSSGEIEPASRIVVYEGDCPNENCDLTLHARGPDGVALGPGAAIRCASCATEFRGRPDGYKTRPMWYYHGRCPICSHEYVALADADRVYKGNKILVNKFSYKLGKPERFDVIVFEFDQWKNYIKRLVGLPGETISIAGGDLYVDGKIVRKLDHPYVQEELWQKISDSSVVENGLAAKHAWSENALEGQSFWSPQQERTRWGLNHPGGDSRRAELWYQRDVDDYLGYNLRSGVPQGERLPVGDLKLSFDVHPMRGDGWIGAELRDGERTFVVRLPVGSASAGPGSDRIAAIEEVPTDGANRLEGSELATVTAPVTLRLDRASRVVIENVDDTLRVSIDGVIAMRLDYVSVPDPRKPPGGPHRVAIGIVGAGVQAEFRAIELYRDIYYVGSRDNVLPGSVWSSLKLGDDEFLAMGDNSPSSSDGRYWGAVPRKNLMGKGLLVFWPAWPLNFQCKFIR